MGILETTTAIYDAFGRGDIPFIIDQCADDVQWEQWPDNRAQQAGVPVMQARTGKAGVAEFFAAVGTMSVIDIRVGNILVGGNQAVVDFTMEASLPGGGHFRDDELHLWTFGDDGKVVAFRHYLDTAKQIAAWAVAPADLSRAGG